MLSRLALFLLSSVVVAQGCYISSNPALRNYISQSGSVTWQNNICSGGCSPFNDCYVTTPLVKLQGGAVLGGYIQFIGMHEALARVPVGQSDPCGTDLPLQCAFPNWLGAVGFFTADYILSPDITNTVDCRVRVDQSTFGMVSQTGVEGGSEFVSPSFQIPNDTSWLGIILYWQGFEFFNAPSSPTINRMMGSQTTFMTITSQ